MRDLNRMNFRKLINSSKRYPPGELLYKVLEKLHAPYRDYSTVCGRYLPTDEELQKQRQEQFAYMPLFSVIVPAYETDELFLRQMMDSVIAQTYENWELCIADASKSEKVAQVIRGDYKEEKRIKYRRLAENRGIPENTNQGLEMAGGAYIALLDHDDVLVPSALYEMVKRINETGADFLYSDEDKASADLGEYLDPHFKLDFNRELLLGKNYICHLLVVSAELVKKAGGLDARYNGAQDFEFALRCSRYAKGIEHISKVLYHWRMHAASTAGNTDSKLYAYEAGRRAAEDFIHQEGWEGTVTMANDLGTYHIRYQVPAKLQVALAAWGRPSRVWEKKVYPQICKEMEALGAEFFWLEGSPFGKEQSNASRDKMAVLEAEILLLVNRGAKTVGKDSIRFLLGSLCRPGIAAVGGRTIQKKRVLQCGYWEKDEKYVPRFQGLFYKFKGYYHRAYLPTETDAVSNDLAVVKTEALEKAFGKTWTENRKCWESGGLRRWQEACGKVKALGSRVIAEPAAEIWI